MTLLDSYPGSKAGSGVWQRIISQMPAHVNYFEPFLGHGAVLRRKKPAPALNVGCDVDAGVIDWWACSADARSIDWAAARGAQSTAVAMLE
jgi:DNA adenine methylase